MAPTGRRHPRRPGDDLLKRAAVVWLAGAVLVAVAAGCGGTKQPTSTSTTPQLYKTAVRVYFLRDGKMQPALREVITTSKDDAGAAGLALGALADGPTPSEARRGLGSAVEKSDSTGGVRRDNVPFVNWVGLSRTALAQVVYTLTQFRPAHAAIVNGKRYTRADFEDETPAILVEAPLSGAQVVSPLVLTGTANTFEATFEYELVDSAGKIVAKHFATATSGSGTRGTFHLTIPFSGAAAGAGKLVVYESSAKDGSRIHVVEIPVRFTG